MTPREIDALVAEKVMGWKNIRFEDERTPAGVEGFGEHEGFQNIRMAFPHYSTDISDAWKVVEKMNETMPDTWSFQVFGGKKDWHCEIDSNDGRFLQNGPTIFACSNADTAPMAICLAALKSVGVEI